MKKLILTIVIGFSSLHAYAFSLKSIKDTCSNFTITKASIKANCIAENGGKYITSLRLRGVQNHNGVLKVNNNSRIMSDFHVTCTKVAVDENGVLGAACKNSRNAYVWTFLDLNPILSNYNGTLVYPSAEN